MSTVAMKGCVVFECLGIPGVLNGIIRAANGPARIIVVPGR